MLKIVYLKMIKNGIIAKTFIKDVIKVTVIVVVKVVINVKLSCYQS